jgi:hypothetical protein
VRRAIWAVASLIGALAAAVGALGVWSASASTVSGPSLGRTIELAPVSGHVFVRLPRASQSVALVHPMVVPVGSRIDTTHGTVDLTSEGPAETGLQNGVFGGGAFIVQQPRSGQTNLILTGGTRPAVCGSGRGSSARAANVSPRVLRLLHASARGRFTTSGRYAAATVLGTIWTTADTCAGTTISSEKDTVDTTANTLPESVHVPLTAGESVTYRCATRAGGPVKKAYCVVVLTSNAPAPNQPAFSTFLATTNPAQSAQLCVEPPGAPTPECTTYPLSHPTDLGLRDLNVACPASQGPGLYRIAYRLDGVALGSPFDYQAPNIRLGHGPCQSFLGQLKQGPDTAAVALAGDRAVARTGTDADGRSRLRAGAGHRVCRPERRPWRARRGDEAGDDPPHERVNALPAVLPPGAPPKPWHLLARAADRRRLGRRWRPRLPNSTLSAGEHQRLRGRPQQPVRADCQRRQRPDDTAPALPTRPLKSGTGVPLPTGRGTRCCLTPPQ